MRVSDLLMYACELKLPESSIANLLFLNIHQADLARSCDNLSKFQKLHLICGVVSKLFKKDKKSEKATALIIEAFKESLHAS